MRRELEEAEKAFCRKQMKRIREEIGHLEYLERYNTLMIQEGLRRNYEEKLMEFKKIREQVLEEIKEDWRKLGMLQEQIDKGVEIKEEEKVVPVGVG